MNPPDDKELLDEFGLGFDGRKAPSQANPSSQDLPSAKVDLAVGGVQHAQGELREVRNALDRLARERFHAGPPLTKNVRGRLRDSTQLGIQCDGVFSPRDWTLGPALPVVQGVARLYASFKPEKAIVSETLVATFDGPLGQTSRAATVADNGDVTMTSLWCGASNLIAGGIKGSGLSPLSPNSSGNLGGLLPDVPAGLDITAAFEVDASALRQVDPPPGYSYDDLVSLKVQVRLNLIGSVLR